MTGFALTVSMPGDARFAECLRALAAQAARQVGCEPADADTFSTAVVDAAQACFAGAGHSGDIPIVIRQTVAELEVLLECGRTIRVARPLPNVV